jgi:hypothetical protein
VYSIQVLSPRLELCLYCSPNPAAGGGAGRKSHAALCNLQDWRPEAMVDSAGNGHPDAGKCLRSAPFPECRPGDPFKDGPRAARFRNGETRAFRRIAMRAPDSGRELGAGGEHRGGGKRDREHGDVVLLAEGLRLLRNRVRRPRADSPRALEAEQLAQAVARLGNPIRHQRELRVRSELKGSLPTRQAGDDSQLAIPQWGWARGFRFRSLGGRRAARCPTLET